MYDFVANHASIDNPLEQNALLARHLPERIASDEEIARCKDFVIAFSSDDMPSKQHLEQLARPRAFPVLSPYAVYEGVDGPCACIGEAPKGARVYGTGVVWTTFSRQQSESGEHETRQVDLKFGNPELFLEVLRISRYLRARESMSGWSSMARFMLSMPAISSA